MKTKPKKNEFLRTTNGVSITVSSNMSYRVVGCAGDAPPVNLFLRQLAIERETRKVKKYEEQMLVTPMYTGDNTLEMDHDGPQLKEVWNPLPRIMKCERDYQERLMKENILQYDHKRGRDFIDHNEPDFKRMCINSTTSNLANLQISNNNYRKRSNEENMDIDNEQRKQRMKNE
jgi:hypothetical protein